MHAFRQWDSSAPVAFSSFELSQMSFLTIMKRCVYWRVQIVAPVTCMKSIAVKNSGLIYFICSCNWCRKISIFNLWNFMTIFFHFFNYLCSLIAVQTFSVIHYNITNSKWVSLMITGPVRRAWSFFQAVVAAMLTCC